MNSLRKITLLVKEIGAPDLASYLCYQFQLRSGLLRRRTPFGGLRPHNELTLESHTAVSIWYTNWQNARWTNDATLLTDEAVLISKGKFRPFFGNIHSMTFFQPTDLEHWTAYSNEFEGMDIKFIWEPVRFNWSLALARSYHLTMDENYPRIFWERFEEFNAANPVNSGPNWSSGQEVALRMIMWILAASAFGDSPSTSRERITKLSVAVRHHIERILPTLSYARSQRNNHHLSEALGLMLGGEFLRENDPRANGWIARGVREFEQAVQRQVDEDGNYAQYSTNYHRMMLQLSLLYAAFLEKTGRKMQDEVNKSLQLATRWLIANLDIHSGRLPNLGHNDGTLFLPFGSAEFRDYRPTAQAAAIAFLGQPCLPSGRWDELSSWLGLYSTPSSNQRCEITSPAVHKVGTPDCWASLRGVRFHNRPAHADQLHVEIWCSGENLARDPGTYLYNAPPPWQNALDGTQFHNTATVDGKNQMQRISRFLWLDQAQAKFFGSEQEGKITAAHDGYRHIGIEHKRTLESPQPGSFKVTDTFTPAPSDRGNHVLALHWLLPDWEWSLDRELMTLSGKKMKALIEVHAINLSRGNIQQPLNVSLIRAGETLTGQYHNEIHGWESDTYGEKHPALSLSFRYETSGILSISTEWKIIQL